MDKATPPMTLLEMRDCRYVDPQSQRIIIGVLTCNKHAGRANGVRVTWARQLPETYRLLFLFGRPGQPPQMVGDQLFLDCPEAYEALPQKVHAFLQYCHEHFDFDYIFKTDDDTFLDLERFIGFDKQGGDYIGQFLSLENVNSAIARTWHYGKCEDKTFEKPYQRQFLCPWATGGGYFLSRKAAQRAVSRTKANHLEHIFEDLMIGEALTRDAELNVVNLRFAEMGIVNPLLPKDMCYLRDILLEKRLLAEQVVALERQRKVHK
ncbi:MULTISPECIES: hypothetical protein [Aphanothece]|uniref:hypothetical protein n=1 Tax=Aphanothece TaxID=1121 RepID=UPI003984E186